MLPKLYSYRNRKLSMLFLIVLTVLLTVLFPITIFYWIFLAVLFPVTIQMLLVNTGPATCRKTYTDPITCFLQVTQTSKKSCKKELNRFQEWAVMLFAL